MAYTFGSAFAAAAAESLTPWLNDDLSWWLDAVGSMFDPTYTVVADQGDDGDAGYVPGYGVLFDVDSCPAAALAFLGQLVGVQVPVGTPEATARQLVRDRAGFQRGTPGAVIAAAQRWLTGAKRVSLFERTAASGSADAYHFVLGVRPEELVDQASLSAAVNAVKPGGLMWTLVVSDAFTFNEALHTFAADTFAFDQADTTQP